MALVHAQPLDVINVRPLAAQLGGAKTHSLLKSTRLQLMRVILLAGQTLPEHSVPGEITLQCLEGEVLVRTPGRQRTLQTGELMMLPGGEAHALQAALDSSVLVTVLLHS